MKLNEQQMRAVLSPLSQALENSKSRYRREDMFDRYMGEPYPNDQNLKDSQSKFKSTDVSDVVEAVFAEGMEIFAGDDHLVEFAAVGHDDEPAARQETEVIHHLFRENNNSFLNIATWFKEGLIEQNAYVRAGWVEKDRVLIEEYDDLSLAEFMTVYERIVSRDGDYEIEELEGIENVDALMAGEIETPIPSVDPNTGQPSLISVRARCVSNEQVYEIEPIPQNEFFVTPRWAKPTLDGCPVCGHRARKTKGELVALGFDQESIRALSDIDDDSTDFNRHITENNDDILDDERGADGGRMEVCEAYILADVDKNGRERLLKIWTDGEGKTVLKWEGGAFAVEEVECRPFAAWTPFCVPHRHVGRALGELAAPIQYLKTVLWRQTLDNLYKTNYPRPIVGEEGATKNTYQDLMSPDPGKVIRMGDITQFQWSKPPSVLGETLPLMDRADQELEKSAGATRYAQGLDPNALSKSQIGSEGVGRIMDAAMRRIQIILRTFAESGLRELFLIMHRDMRRGPSRQLTLKLRDEWVEVNPLTWRDRTDMTVRIGTGRGDREKRIAALSWVLERQQQRLAAGDPSVTPQHVFEAEKRIARSMGLQSIEPFIADPASLPPPQPAPPQPDIAAQAQMALAEAEQLKAQAAMVKAQNDQRETQAMMGLKAEELRLNREIAQIKAREAEANLGIKRAELDIKRADMSIKGAKAVSDIEADAQKRDTAFIEGHP